LEKKVFDITLTKDLTELIGKNFTFPDIESIGKYVFKKYNTHAIENVNENISISPINAARILVFECEKNNRLSDLFSFIIEMDGGLLNGKRVAIPGMDNLLYRLSSTGIYFDFNKRSLRSYNQDKKTLKNWGVLKDGKEYPIGIASIDICENTKLVKTYKTAKIEEVYFHLREYIRKKCEFYDGRIWFWAGDGCIVAFRDDEGLIPAVSCCLEILFSLPIFNTSPLKRIPDEISLRIGMDWGTIKYYEDTGSIVSDVINSASRIEKNATCPDGLSVSDNLFQKLPQTIQQLFLNTSTFDGAITHTLSYDYKKAIA
jgi:class 3 adenylate cyclase